MPQTRKRKGKDSAATCADNQDQVSLEKPTKSNKNVSKRAIKLAKTNQNKHEISNALISNHSDHDVKKDASKRAKRKESKPLLISSEELSDFNKCKRKEKRSSSPSTIKEIKRAKVVLENIKHEKNFENEINSSDSGILLEPVNEVNDCLPNCSGVDYKLKNETSSESEWEEVEDQDGINLDDYKPEIPKEGVEITIDCPELQIRKRKQKKFDENEWIRLYINRTRKDIQMNVHKVHLLCLFAHGLYINNILNSDDLKARVLSVIPNEILNFTSGKKIDKIDCDGIEKIMHWFCDTFSFKNEKENFVNIFPCLLQSCETCCTLNATQYNLLYIVIARALGFKVRFCISLYPITHKAQNLIKKPNSKHRVAKIELSDSKTETIIKTDKHVKQSNNRKMPKKAKISKLKKSSDGEEVKPVSRPRRSKGKSYKLSSDEDDNLDDEDFVSDDFKSSDDRKIKQNLKQKSHLSKKLNKKINRKVLSSDSESESSSSSSQCNVIQNNIVCWIEVFSKPDKQWICIECSSKLINKPYDIEALLPKPISYILAFDNKSCVKDITRRYCNQYLTVNVKLRVDPEWWEETLEPFLPPNTKLDKEEERKLDQILVNKPLPQTISEYKNHPLYALKRHLLKFEAIYPSDAPPVGFIRGEPVYARDCVHQLHSRETWHKEARVVRIGEEPYKIVKARPKWDKIAGVLRTDLPLEVFGFWQTEQYEPPIAVNGKVPRNEYGNVELFKPCMLPKGTVHLQLPGLNRIAKKLNIDCSPAVVGFDGHKGSIHPVFDGFVICEEFKDTIIAAWDEEQENIRKREIEKREKRIYGNWKKLIKGLLIRERIKLKYTS